MNIPESKIREVIRVALEEDIPHEDVTVTSLKLENVQARGFIKAKERAVLAGIDVARLTFIEVDTDVFFEKLKEDGDEIEPGEVVATVVGKASSLLMGERVALNFLSHMSGIATFTKRCVEIIKGNGIVLVDTRKTLPGLRALQKYAVRVGGGKNHRFSLAGGILIKDNHIAVVGSIKEAVRRAKENALPWSKIEVEVNTLDEAKEAVDAGADVIMLDNFPINQIEEAIRIIKGKAEVEISGGVDEKVLEKLSGIKGVHYVSIGSLTHSVAGIDFTFELMRDEG